MSALPVTPPPTAPGQRAAPIQTTKGVPFGRRLGVPFPCRLTIEALLSDTIDVGPLDSYALDLMLRHEPALGERIRVVASTLPAPIPFLVASPHCPAEAVSALRQALLSFGDAVGCAVLRERLKLAGFASVRIADYDLILDRDAQARAAGYLHPA